MNGPQIIDAMMHKQEALLKLLCKVHEDVSYGLSGHDWASFVDAKNKMDAYLGDLAKPSKKQAPFAQKANTVYVSASQMQWIKDAAAADLKRESE